jgi:hypothetical protein
VRNSVQEAAAVGCIQVSTLLVKLHVVKAKKLRYRKSVGVVECNISSQRFGRGIKIRIQDESTW